MTTKTNVREATQPTIDLINRLQEERDLTLVWEPGMSTVSDEHASTEARTALEASRTVWKQMGFLPQTTASTLINYLKEAPRKSVQKDNGEIEGMHKVGVDIYKVQRAVHGSGNLYAKKLDTVCVEQPDYDTNTGGIYKGVFNYAPGAIRLLSQETLMTLAEAKEYGALYGVCCQCGATLTDENSIEAGIGPVCGKKFQS